MIAHNHNHLTIWKSKRLNALTDYWLTQDLNATAKGTLQFGNGTITETDDAYGIDIFVQQYEASPDWDHMLN